MCQFCSLGPNTVHEDRDNDPFAFGSYFSGNDVCEVVRLTSQNKCDGCSSLEEEEGEGDVDGT